MRGKLPFSYGFTLIELLVSVLVISILFSLGYANFRRYSQKQAVWGVARQIEGDLRKAQSYAMAGRTGCSGGYLSGYQFSYINPQAYAIESVCGGGGSSIFIQNFSIPNGFTITNFDPIVFYTPKGNTNLAANTNREIRVQLFSGLFPIRITVSPGGQITVSE